jgi:hypothetical protein
VTARARTALVALAAAALIATAGCGGDDEGAPIPAATATALNGELDGVQRRLDEGSAGACRDILEGSRGPNLERVRELIDAMPDDVDADVRSALEDSFDRLWELVERDCDEKAAEEEDAQPAPEPEPEPPPEETETETTPTETTPTETTPPEEEQLPPGEGDGTAPGNGNGNGNGNGGGFGPGGAEQGGGE